MNDERLGRIYGETLGRLELTRRTFHVAKKNAGFLGLGAKIQVLVDGKVSDEAVVYGDTLHAMAEHQMAMASGDLEKIRDTNNKLPERFRIQTVLYGD